MNKELFGMEVEQDNLSTSDESSDDDGNELLERRAVEIEGELSNNVYLYELHKELISICEKTGDLPSLRLAFDRFSKTFPLTEELWLKWIKIEISIAEDEKQTILGLFQRATKDYLSVKLWLEFIQYAISRCELEETHVILEKALSTAGLHYSDASLLWDTLRELELAHLAATPKDTDAYKTQLNKVIDAFQRQLSVPLLNITSTYDEWLEFSEQQPDIDRTILEAGYKKALESVENYKPFEERLLMASDDQELVDIYGQYIKAVKNPSLIICLYERAIVKLCLLPQVWIDYVNYTLKLGDPCLEVSERALRNVTWCEELWCMRMKVLEKLEQPVEEVTKCFESGLCHIPTGLDLWLDYIAFTKRKQPEKLLKLLEQASEQPLADAMFKVRRYHALECARSGLLEKSREIWNALLLDATAKRSSQLWLEFVRLERRYGSVASARSVFSRAMTCSTDWPQGIADEWTAFERDEGTLDNLLKSSERIQKALQAQSLQVSWTQATAGRKRRGGELQMADGSSSSKKQKPASKQVAPLVKNQGAPGDLDVAKSVFVSNLSPTVGASQVGALFDGGRVTLATNNKGSSRCFAYVQFATAEEAETALGRDRTPLEGRPVFVSRCRAERSEREAAFRYAQAAEKHKLFVRGLPLAYVEADVERLFAAHGCTAVRLVVHRSGRSKGLAYVEFPSADDATRALQATDGSVVEGLVISVAISAPPSKEAAKALEAPVRHARSRLQVPLVPRVALRAATSTSTTQNGDDTTVAGKPLPLKSNNDFRNMFLNK